jgi:hypothetical protein
LTLLTDYRESLTMTDPVERLALETIRTLDLKMEKSGFKNVSHPFSYDLTNETIKAVTAKVVAHYQPLGIICRLDFSQLNVGVRARLRVTKAPK